MTDAPGAPRPPQQPLPYTGEMKRKALHILTLIIPIGLLLVGKPWALALLIPAAGIAVFADTARVRVPWFRTWIERLFGFMMRPSEWPALGDPVVLNGATWVLIASVLTIAIFPVPVAAAALAIFLIGDAAAALVGRRFGRIRLGSTGKTLEGALAFILSTLPITFWLPGPSAWLGIAGICAAAVAEVLPGPLNDNLQVPLSAGLVMVGLQLLL